jgi:hypothetical protein
MPNVRGENAHGRYWCMGIGSSFGFLKKVTLPEKFFLRAEQEHAYISFAVVSSYADAAGICAPRGGHAIS